MENNKNMIDRVFVQNKHGKPLMPTTPRKARLLLETGNARIVKHDPFFTIKGMQNHSKYFKLDGLTKPVKTAIVNPVRWRKGICAVA